MYFAAPNVSVRFIVVSEVWVRHDSEISLLLFHSETSLYLKSRLAVCLLTLSRASQNGSDGLWCSSQSESEGGAVGGLGSGRFSVLWLGLNLRPSAQRLYISKYERNVFKSFDPISVVALVRSDP